MNDDEAQKKVMFDDFWKTVLDYDKSAEQLKAEFSTWYEVNKPQIQTEATQTTVTSPEGTTTTTTETI